MLTCVQAPNVQNRKSSFINRWGILFSTSLPKIHINDARMKVKNQSEVLESKHFGKQVFGNLESKHFGPYRGQKREPHAQTMWEWMGANVSIGTLDPEHLPWLPLSSQPKRPCQKFREFSTRKLLSCRSGRGKEKGKAKMGAYAMKGITSGSSPWLFEPAKRPDGRVNYCLDYGRELSSKCHFRVEIVIELWP